MVTVAPWNKLPSQTELLHWLIPDWKMGTGSTSGIASTVTAKFDCGLATPVATPT